jgi:hypothetical protein
MDDIIVGSEALAAGLVTRHQLRTKYIKLHHNVYARKGIDLDAIDRARAAWLWSRRRATLVGLSAAALHGTQYLPDDAPAELARIRQPAPPGIVVHCGLIAHDEICLRQSLDCTTPARTAYDIGRRTEGDRAITGSTRYSTPHGAQSRKSSASPTGTPVREACVRFARP